MAIDPHLKQLLEDWEDLRDAGKTPTPEEHCRDCLDLLESFRRLLRKMEWFEGRGDPACDGGAAPKAVSEAASRAVRFRVIGEPSFGGMGEVYPARDEELGRNVALKFIQSGKGGSAAERRFRREVAITARLQHPGIVPVYGRVASEDGRSGYAMRHIPGASLHAAIDSHHAGDAAGKRKPTRADLLRRFEAVCDTMAYAHRHRVIHRDLKPANVMLGDLGETFVVDWGLAKVLTDGHAEEAASGELTAMAAPADDSSGEGVTAAGWILGTFAYMPPEQANGDYANLDERADVFALGAMLCKILTGQPPYSGDQALQMARDTDLTACFARLDASGADAELVALAKRCLAKSRGDRPENAQAVLEAVRAYTAAVESRAREERERRVAAEAKAVAERRRRRATVALGVSVVGVLLVGGAAIWIWQLRQAEKSQVAAAAARQAEERDRDILAGLAETSRLRDLGRLGEARQALEGTEKRVADGAPAELAERARQARKNWAMVAELAEAPLAGLHAGFDPGPVVESYRKAFRQYGIDMEALDPAKAAASIRASEIREQLIVGLDDWAYRLPVNGALKARLVEAAERADHDTLRHELRQKGGAAERLDWQDLEKLLDRYEVSSLRPTTAIRAGGGSIQFLRKVQQAHPNDFWANYSLFETLSHSAAYHPTILAEAIGFLRVAVALRPDIANGHNFLGAALKQQGRPDEAEAEFRWAIKLKGDDPLYRVNLGSVLTELGRWAEAGKELRKAIQLKEDLAEAHYALATWLAVLSKRGEAEKEFRRAIQLKKDYPDAHINLGAIHVSRGNFDKAILSYRQALEAPSIQGQRRTQVEQGISRCNYLLELDKTLAAVLKGDTQVNAAERIECAFICQAKQRYAAAARLYAQGFVEQPALADDLAAGKRYWAACAAALAGLGRGDDASNPSDKECARLRNQALTWLRANLTAYDKMPKGDPRFNPKMQYELRRWQADADLAGVREAHALAKLPESERQAWQKLWADVDALVKELAKLAHTPLVTP